MEGTRRISRRLIAGGIVLAVLYLPLTLLDQQADLATLDAALDPAVEQLETDLKEKRPGDGEIHPAVVSWVGVPDVVDRRRILARLDRAKTIDAGDQGERMDVSLVRDESGAATLTLVYAPSSNLPVTVEQTHRAIHPSSVLPPLIAVVLAYATGRVILSLLLAVLVGGLLSQGLDPVGFGTQVAVEYFWKSTVTDAFKLWILGFTTMLLGMVHLATRSGGVQGVVDRIAVLARDVRSTQLATVFMGIAVFFDDYANSILVGTTMRPLMDRMRISREKLAYLVDSTSAPVAGVAVISTWIGYEVGLFGDVAHSLGIQQDGYGVFFAALPFRFYCLFTLGMLFSLVYWQRDFGPMYAAERRAALEGDVIGKDATPLASVDLEEASPLPGITPMAHVALVPISLVLVGTIGGLFWDGGGLAAVQGGTGSVFSFSTWRDAFGSADNSTFILAMAALSGSVALLILVAVHKLMPVPLALKTYVKGAKTMLLAVAILVLAWAIKATCDDLGTSRFLVASLEEVVSPALLPMLVFLLAAVVAFATGTSWATMGILIPTAGPLAMALGGEPILFVTLAAVLDGAIFGDHCSPISDTTVMSSIASGSDHVAHVRTQVPYALTSMVVALVFGYGWEAIDFSIPGVHLPAWIGWILGLVALFVLVRVVGKDPRADLPAGAPAADAA